MLYYKLFFICIFLPIILILYQLSPKRIRWIALLIANFIFYINFNFRMLVFLVPAIVITYITGRVLDRLNHKKKALLKEFKENKAVEGFSTKAEIKDYCQKRSRLVLILGIALILSVLLVIKYYGFFATNINLLIGRSTPKGPLPIKIFELPLGISFYSMQAIAYMADIYWTKYEAEKNPFKLALYLSFFLTIVEGPIALYSDMKDRLFEGNSIYPDNIARGLIRLMWGIMKKLVIADRLSPAVILLFSPEHQTKGHEVIAAAVLFTVMEYMDFSGCMDMVIGIGTMFGIQLPENFRQPFFAKNASEFWRRWHISLGVWFKTYIFYPVSMSKLAKKWNKFSKNRVNKHITRVVASAIALLPVWLCNGLWHGPKWTYIFYGVFYFVVIVLELLLEPVGDAILKLLHTSRDNKVVDIVRILKTWIIIFAGELFFQADSLSEGMRMIRDIGKGFSLSTLFGEGALGWGLDIYDWILVAVMMLTVIIVNTIREKGIDICDALLHRPLVIRWALLMSLLMVITIFGCYGPGYEEVDLIYAGF